MKTNVNRFTRLSREKTTGNVILISAAFVGALLFIRTGYVTAKDQIMFFAVTGLIIAVSVFVHKSLRKPFFSEVSRYISSLHDQRIDIQQVFVSIDLIESFQLLSNVEIVISQIQQDYDKVSDLLKQANREISLRKHPFQSSEVQKLLSININSAEEVLLAIEKKQHNIILLARTRSQIFQTINNRISRPQNEIELDYLNYRAQKDQPELLMDTALISDILHHSLENGELIGRVKKDRLGEEILIVRESRVQISDSLISWQDTNTATEYCVICRQSIRTSGEKVTCPECNNAFHRTHLLEWLKVFNQCPMCHHKIRGVLDK
ncbi:MAG: RING finger protein [Candidatus Hodarchaeales archaeon]